MVPVAIFVRVSSKRQEYQRQISELQAIADQRRYQVVNIISEVGSASKRKRAERPELQQLLDLASSGTIKKILVSEISRLGRRPSETLDLIEQITEFNVSIYAKNLGMETLLDNGKRNPAASIVFILFAELARIETEYLSDRIRSGQEEARRKGKDIGRPNGTGKSDEQLLKEYPKAVKYLKENFSIRKTAKLAGVSTPTVVKIRKALNDLYKS